VRSPAYTEILEAEQTDKSASTNKVVGLCATCAHVETIRSDRVSTFYRRLLSARDPRFRCSFVQGTRMRKTSY
jgi:hypothetical protein